MRLSEALDLWLEKKRRELTPVYVKTLRRWTQNWLVVFSNKEVSDVMVADVEKLEALRDNGRRSASALNQERVYLRGFFEWARALGYTAMDPVATWKFRRPVVRREYATITREEEDRLVAAAPEMPWLQKYVVLAVCTGLREGTIRRLTWAMVREKDGVLEIPARLMKTRHAHQIALPARALAALGPRGTGLLIGDLPTKDNVYRGFKRAAKRAGISSVTSPHDLRRTWVERLSRAGQPLQVIQSLGAWKTVSVLLNHYVLPVSTDLQRKILEAV